MDLAWRTLVAATRDPEFWRCYAFDDADGFDVVAAGEKLARQLNGIDVDEDDWDDGDEDDGEDDDGWDDEDEDYDVPDVSVELGHWDQARWHPFCLRWSELEAVVAQMRAAPDPHPLPPEVGMLLLARWVGHGSDEAALLNDRRVVIAGTFERLGLFRGDDAVRMAAQLMQAVPEDDYAWRWDAERGWLLSGDYAGYSIRNDCHSRFPFPEFTEFRRQLAVADGPGGRF